VLTLLPARLLLLRATHAQVTLRSLFSIQNCTDHALLLVAHPDRGFTPTAAGASSKPPSPNTAGTASATVTNSGAAPLTADAATAAARKRRSVGHSSNSGTPTGSSDATASAAAAQQQQQQRVDHVLVEPGKVHNLPLLLLQKAIELERGAGLGYVWVRPAAHQQLQNQHLGYQQVRSGGAAGRGQTSRGGLLSPRRKRQQQQEVCWSVACSVVYAHLLASVDPLHY
jgi:hypothetical protein